MADQMSDCGHSANGGKKVSPGSRLNGAFGRPLLCGWANAVNVVLPTTTQRSERGFDQTGQCKITSRSRLPLPCHEKAIA